MTPQEWASAANKLSRANPGLTRAEIITKMNLQGMPRPSGVENKGKDLKGNPRFGKKTRSQGQAARRRAHEQPSTPESDDNLQRLRQEQEEINNIAAYAGLEGAHHEHRYPSDATDTLGNEGAPGDYVDNRPNPYSKWKTALEQYNRTKRDNRYRLIETPEGVRIVDSRYADVRVDPYELPGMDIDESMDVDQVFSVLPYIVAQDLSLRRTQFPGTQANTGIQVTAGQAQWKSPPLGGFVGKERTPYVTPPSPKYVPPLVQQYSYQTNGNGNGNGDGNGNGNGNVNGNGNGNGNGTTPSNGNGNGNGNLVEDLIDMTSQLDPQFKNPIDLAPVFTAGQVILRTAGTAAALAGSYLVR